MKQRLVAARRPGRIILCSVHPTFSSLLIPLAHFSPCCHRKVNSITYERPSKQSEYMTNCWPSLSFQDNKTESARPPLLKNIKIRSLLRVSMCVALYQCLSKQPHLAHYRLLKLIRHITQFIRVIKLNVTL
jgi:hypothetical protein